MMKRHLALLSLLIIGVTLFTASVLSAADFNLCRKIPAPKACVAAQANKVTGLGWRDVGHGALFVTTQCNGLGWHNYVHLVRPSDGLILYEAEYTFAPFYCGAGSPHLTSGDHISGTDYVVGDECGEITWITFDSDTLFIWDSADPPHIGELSGLIYRGDTLYAVDRDSLDLVAVQVDGYNVVGRYPLPLVSPSAVAMHDGNLFILSSSDSTRIFEMTTAGAVVDTHSVEGLYGCYPQSAVFVGDLLYVGGILDSILVFSRYDYTVPLEPGDSVEVEVVPGEVDITFDGILESGYVNANVLEEQPCPPPAGVEFFSDFYEISSTASLEYVSEVALSYASIPDGADEDLVRVFVRPSGYCQVWRDITVDSTNVPPPVISTSKRLSEDDEFSFFALAIDGRDQNDVIDFKFGDLSGHINSAEDSIPAETYADIRDLLTEAEERFSLGQYRASADLVDSLAEVVRGDPQIPRVFDPEDPGKNVAGRLIGRAHTLAFSIRFYPRWLAGTGPGTAVEPDFLQVRPNPSSSLTEIKFAPRGSGEIEVAVYSVKGQRIRSLYKRASGSKPVSLVWDGNDQEGRLVAPGVYFIVASQGPLTSTRKVVVQR
jgi:hypothetical protein